MQLKSLLWAVGVGAAAAVTAELVMPQQMQEVRHYASQAMNKVEDGVAKAADALK